MMHKGMVIGAGVGLLLLVFLAGMWVNAPSLQAPGTPGAPQPAPRAPAPAAPAASAQRPSTAAPAPEDSGAQDAAGVAPRAQQRPSDTPLDSAAAHPGRKRIDPQERRKIHAAVQAKMAALRAKGANVTLQDASTLMDEIEALGQGQFDARYFATMRKIIEYSARVQVLNKELSQIATQNTPAADTRKMALLAEMRDLADRIQNGSQALQSYARDALAEQQP